MELQVLAFGATKDCLGNRMQTLNFSSNCSVKTFKEELAIMYPSLNWIASFQIAVNQKIVSPDCILKVGDEVALIPPVSGG